LFLCLVFFTNAFNLLDNIDGLCATTAIAILLSLIIFNSEDNLNLLLPLAALTGFLLLNRPKAKIFMGDSGSLFIGAICVLLTVVRCNFVNFFGSSSLNYLPLFWLPIYDTFSVIIVRLNAGKSVLIGGKDHFSHRLMKRGMSNWSVITVLFFITLIAGTVSLYSPPFFSLAIFIFLITASASYELLTRQK
jgi:UDP-GlcNAc:undecaprenyl-phosphate GlcNAc-1-phosphate transferase